jgi:SPP1 gp7 family putative phage head morphogenesis protein
MADRAHRWTDRKIEDIERELARIYRRAEKEVGEKWKSYMGEVGKRVEDAQKAYDAAKASGDKDLIRRTGMQLSKAKKEMTITNAHYKELTRTTAKEISRVNETAAAYVNGQLPEVYARNYNHVASGISTGMKGYSFELVDASTVRNLALSDKTLLPYKVIDGVKDVRWNVQRVNSEVLQGILQGDSMPNIAERLSKVLGMNETSAIRNARTSVTSAENKGRMDMIEDAEEKGVHTQKMWIATKDNRTRDSHLDIDGDLADPDDTFANGLLYPGDPNGAPEEVYNCRCTLGYKIVGIGRLKF